VRKPQWIPAAAARVVEDPVCGSIKIDGDVHAWFCDARIIEAMQANGQWYLSHQMKVTAQYDSLWSALDNTYMSVIYAPGGAGGGNRFIDVDPWATESIGSCANVTMSVSWGGFAASYQQPVCPQRIGPRFYEHGYGVNWEGLSSYWRGVHGAAIVSSTPGVAASRTVDAHMFWTIK